MFTEIPASEWRALIGSALTFSAIAPWEWVGESQVFGVLLPESGEKVYCSVLGQAGMMKAIALYPGQLGWKSYLDLGAQSTETDTNEVVVRQRCLFTSFVSQDQADADDLALLKHIGQTLVKGQPVPMIRSYRPGFVPQPPNLAEIQLMRRVFAKALELLTYLPGAHFALPTEGLNEEGKVLFSVATANGAGPEFQWLAPDSTLDFSPTVVTLSIEQRALALSLPLVEGIWLMENFYLTKAAETEDGTQFYPQVFCFLDLEAQGFRGVSLLEPDGFPDLVGAVLTEMLRQQGCRPSQIVVSKKQNLILLRPFCKTLGIGIHLDEEIDILPALRETVEAQMDFSDR